LKLYNVGLLFVRFEIKSVLIGTETSHTRCPISMAVKYRGSYSMW